MPKTRQQKETVVVNLTDKFKRAKAVVFTDYKGLTMPQLNDLRTKLHAVDSEFTVTKNTLSKLAFQNTKYQLPNTNFEGPTATLFAFDDEITPIKILVKAIKDAGIGKIKAGILGEDILDETRIQQLSILPSKDELKAKTVGVLVAPLQGMVGVLQANLRNLVYALSEIQKQRGGV